MIGVAILGSTGSIGESTLDVVARHPDRFKLVAIGANRSAAKLAEQIKRHRPAYAALAGACRGERGAKAGSADNRGHHAVNLRHRGDLGQSALAREYSCLLV